MSCKNCNCEECRPQEEIEDDYLDEDDDSFERFDCTCGAWQISKSGKIIHVADCYCGSGEPF